MIKKYLILTLILFSGAACSAQSLTLAELQNLTNMTNDQVHNFLLVTKGFKPKGKTVLNGRNYELFRSNRNDPAKVETVSLSESRQGMGGMSSREVIYFTPHPQDMNSLLEQAKRSSMSMIFQGSDAYQNIFRFDNSLFMAVIAVSHDKKSGTLQLDQK
jgi:hypothetical protein